MVLILNELHHLCKKVYLKSIKRIISLLAPLCLKKHGRLRPAEWELVGWGPTPAGWEPARLCPPGWKPAG